MSTFTNKQIAIGTMTTTLTTVLYTVPSGASTIVTSAVVSLRVATLVAMFLFNLWAYRRSNHDLSQRFFVAFQIDPNSADQGHYFSAAGRLKPGGAVRERKH